MTQIEPLLLADVDAAMQLVEAAGWNQTPADWQRVIDYQPWGCFKATLDNRLVGTVTSTSYGNHLAWIGMMLVDPNARRQGIGRLLMRAVIAALQTTRVATIKLDATPMGRPLYEQLGFVAQFDFHRLRRLGSTAEVQPFEPSSIDSLDQLRQLDRQAFGVDRWEWLSKLAQSSRTFVTRHGFGMIRSGRVADYLGPVVADSLVAATEVVVPLLRSTSAETFWDLPQHDKSVHAWAHELGFTPARVLTRMTLELDTTLPELVKQFALCDPACG